MEKHYFMQYANHKFEVHYGTPDQAYCYTAFGFYWTAKFTCWWKNRKLTKMREFNDHQTELFSGASLALPEE